MNKPTEADLIKISAFLDAKGVTKCKECGTLSHGSESYYSFLPDTATSGGLAFSIEEGIPMIAIVCVNCGFIRNFSLGIINP